MLSDFVWLLKERAVSHLRVFFWFSSKPGAKLKPLVMVITLNQEKTFLGLVRHPDIGGIDNKIFCHI